MLYSKFKTYLLKKDGIKCKDILEIIKKIFNNNRLPNLDEFWIEYLNFLKHCLSSIVNQEIFTSTEISDLIEIPFIQLITDNNSLIVFESAISYHLRHKLSLTASPLSYSEFYNNISPYFNIITDIPSNKEILNDITNGDNCIITDSKIQSISEQNKTQLEAALVRKTHSVNKIISKFWGLYIMKTIDKFDNDLDLVFNIIEFYINELQAVKGVAYYSLDFIITSLIVRAKADNIYIQHLLHLIDILYSEVILIVKSTSYDLYEKADKVVESDDRFQEVYHNLKILIFPFIMKLMNDNGKDLYSRGLLLFKSLTSIYADNKNIIDDSNLLLRKKYQSDKKTYIDKIFIQDIFFNDICKNNKSIYENLTSISQKDNITGVNHINVIFLKKNPFSENTIKLILIPTTIRFILQKYNKKTVLFNNILSQVGIDLFLHISSYLSLKEIISYISEFIDVSIKDNNNIKPRITSARKAIELIFNRIIYYRYSNEYTDQDKLTISKFLQKLKSKSSINDKSKDSDTLIYYNLIVKVTYLLNNDIHHHTIQTVLNRIRIGLL